MRRLLVCAFLVAPAVAYPRFVQCGLIAPTVVGDVPSGSIGGSNPKNRTLTCGSPLMSTHLNTSTEILQLTDFKTGSLLQTVFVHGNKYKIHMPLLMKGAQGIWDVTAGTIGGSTGTANLLNDGSSGCETTRYGSCAKQIVEWTAPGNGTDFVNFTYICALPESARIIKASFSSDANIPHVPNLCENPVNTTSTAVCRNKNLVGSREQENYGYVVLAAAWVVSIQVYNLKMSWGALVGFIVDAGLLGFVVYNAIKSDSRTELYLSIGIWLLVKFLAVSRSRTLKKTASAIAYFFLATLLILSALSSFHHWCNGEQDWDQMSGDWGDYDSWQGTIPWWALGVVWAAYFAFPGAGAQRWSLAVAFAAVLGDVLVGVIGGSEAYSDICTWIQMVTVALFAVAWCISSIMRRSNSTEKEKESEPRSDILGQYQTEYLMYSAAIGVAAVSMFASRSVTGKQVPITMILAVALVCLPLAAALVHAWVFASPPRALDANRKGTRVKLPPPKDLYANRKGTRVRLPPPRGGTRPKGKDIAPPAAMLELQVLRT